MNERQREQVRLIAAHDVDLIQRTLNDRIQTIYADHSAKGRLHSGATIKVSVRSMEELAVGFLADLAAKLAAVAPDSETFTELAGAVARCIELCANQMPDVIRMAQGRVVGPRSESIQRAADDLFSQMRREVEAKLAITAFDFDRPSIGPVSAAPVAPAAKKGGRPTAEFWDDMWAAMAFSLYDGDLVPKSQADVERAMTSWIEGQGHSAAVSTIRARARRLWDRIAAKDD